MVALLNQATIELEKKTRHVNLLFVADNLDIVERLLASQQPGDMYVVRVPRLLQQLKSVRSAEAQHLHARFQAMFDEFVRTGQNAPDYGDKYWKVCYLTEEVVSLLSTQRAKRSVETGLQINRLRSYRWWGLLVVVLLLISVPFVSDNEFVLDRWRFLVDMPDLRAVFISGAGVAMIGAAGGFLSGLLQARRTRVGAENYQEITLNSGLRPLVGAFASLLLYIFLSWQVLPGVTVESAGSFVVLAFLSGFSERYFLRLLKIEPEGEAKQGAAVEVENYALDVFRRLATESEEGSVAKLVATPRPGNHTSRPPEPDVTAGRDSTED